MPSGIEDDGELDTTDGLASTLSVAKVKLAEVALSIVSVTVTLPVNTRRTEPPSGAWGRV